MVFRRNKDLPPKIKGNDKESIKTLIPGSDPIELVSFYKEFQDYYPMCEMQTKRWFLENVKSDWVSLDVGANIGYHSILISRLSPMGRVFSFEPTSTFGMLRRNLQHNATTNVDARQQAVADSNRIGTEPIYRLWGKEPELTEMQFVTIDSFVEEARLERVDFIKIDVDGFDLEVLWGAKKTLDRFSPIVLVELNHALATRGHTPSQAMEWMLERKYSHATVVDADNYIFTKSWNLGDPWPRDLTITFDQRNPLRYLQPVTKKLTQNAYSPQLLTHNGATLGSGFSVRAEGSAWSYALSFELPFTDRSDTAVEVEVIIRSGDLGIFVSDSSGSDLLSKEEFLGSGSSEQRVFPIPVSKKTQIIFRKTTNQTLDFSVSSLNLCEFEFRDSSPRSLNECGRSELAALLHADDNPQWSDQPLSTVLRVSLPQLKERLKTSFEPPKLESVVDPHKLFMERNDAPILEWLYGVLRPQKHLEFGTREGFGTLLCLKSCEAEVWTINLPLGEKDQGVMRYALSREPNDSRLPRGHDYISADGAEAIGWMYKTLNLSNRVHQIIADSTDFDFATATLGLFDTVLVDGGHARGVVLADQRNARNLLSPSGVLIWHDFTLDPQVLADQTSCEGVIAAVIDDISVLSQDFDLLWPEGSMLLLGIPKKLEHSLRK
jgi:FkbM family methyltransferase